MAGWTNTVKHSYHRADIERTQSGHRADTERTQSGHRAVLAEPSTTGTSSPPWLVRVQLGGRDPDWTAGCFLTFFGFSNDFLPAARD